MKMNTAVLPEETQKRTSSGGLQIPPKRIRPEGASVTGDLHVVSNKPLLPPQILDEELPITPAVEALVERTRNEMKDILDGRSDRLICIVGPCSIHDPVAAIDYATRLQRETERFAADLLIVMRVYFEKPRTTVGWKGLINDPDLNDTFNVNKGLRIGRKLLLDVHEIGLPAAVEFLDTISPQYIGDVISWGAIGARTTESQVHRELASGISCPVGFKNGTTGDIQIAADAIKSASSPHHFLGVTKQGLAAIVGTSGNAYTHLILRGGSSGPNYDADSIAAAAAVCEKSGVNPRLMIDCSHGNSLKLHSNQPKVAAAVAEQIAAGNHYIIGVMIESNIKEGAQKLGANGLAGLEYGKSITDACVSFEQTIPMLETLAEAVRARRSVMQE
eukprot:comp23755_c0_seq1/m.41091 comp23755_c0_seq1/g.41091  ORF comp23755_c0_seq1/g.41091 comp23755_c0_seq1/m.41091 type:complete len:389 (-) comp23755_c0_seq1:435-1601(-)